MTGRGIFLCSLVCLALAPMASGTKNLAAKEPKTVFFTGHVDAILDGQTVRLNQGGEVRLLGINVPPGENEKVVSVLESLLEAQEVQLIETGPHRDRWRRLVAQVMRADGLWIQGHLVREGLVRVTGDPDHRMMLTELLHLEDQARQARRGIWGNKDLSPRRAAFMPRATGTFEVVEGTVLSAAIVGGRGYLNFGEDRNRDFTIAAEPEVMRTFTKSGIDWRRYQGRQIRVRGHVGFFAGPRIDVTYPEQIEIVGDASPLAVQSERTNDPTANDPSLAERP